MKRKRRKRVEIGNVNVNQIIEKIDEIFVVNLLLKIKFYKI